MAVKKAAAAVGRFLPMAIKIVVGIVSFFCHADPETSGEASQIHPLRIFAHLVDILFSLDNCKILH